MTADELRAEVGQIQWWHTIDLGQGVITPGSDNSPYKLPFLGFPERFTGLTVLDIGASDGFFSFEAERRGAQRVVAADVWSGDCWGYQPKTGIEIAKRALNSKVETVQTSVMEIDPKKLGMFDVVFFLGVLYHMRYPLESLERVFSVTKGQVILETHIEQVGGDRPMMVFYPDRELNNDPTNWWGPNVAAVAALLRSAGFSKVQKICEYPPHEPKRLKDRLHLALPFTRNRYLTRVVFHAWR